MKKNDLLKIIDCAVEIAQLMSNCQVEDDLVWLKTKLQENIFYLLVIGETSSGKSTFINTIIGHNVIYCAPTATTDHIIEVTQEKGRKEIVVDIKTCDDQIQTISAANYLGQCKNKSDTIKYAWVKTGDLESLPTFTLVDTPGYNSVLEHHTEVLYDFLPNADAVIYMFNFMTMVHKIDREYIQLVNKHIPDFSKVYFACNHIKGRGKDTKSPKIHEMLKKDFGYPDARPLYKLSTSVDHDSRKVESKELLSDIASNLDSKNREQIIIDNAAGILKNNILELWVKYSQIKCSIEQTASVNRETISDYRKLKKKINAFINKAEDSFSEGIDTSIQSFKTRLLEEIKSEVDTDFKNKDAVKERIKKSIIPARFEQLNCDIQTLLITQIEKLENDLSDELQKGVGIIFNKYFRNNDSLLRYLKKAGPIGKESLKNVLLNYFARYGGKAGHKGGFINLSKKTLKGVGGWVNKKFPKSVYDNMGKTLTRFGIKSTRVAGAVAVFVIEGGIFVFDYLTWEYFTEKNAGKQIETHINKLKSSAIEEVKELFNEIRKGQTGQINKLIAAIETNTEKKISNSVQENIENKFNYIFAGCNFSIEE